MLDVVPPSPSPRAKSVRRTPDNPKHVLKVPWKLPARLRRPVSQEIARQRKQAQQKRSIMNFSRRPLVTPTPSPAGPLPSKRSGPPPARLSSFQVPPYTGGFIKQGRLRPPPAQRPVAPRPTTERDAPYTWQKPRGQTMTVPLQLNIYPQKKV